MGPSPSFEGQTLLPLARREADWCSPTEKAREFIGCNQGLRQAKRAISDGRWKLIKALDDGLWPAPALALYDLEEGPGEANHLAGREPDETAALELRLCCWQDAQLGGPRDPVRRIAETGSPSRPWASVQRGVRH